MGLTSTLYAAPNLLFKIAYPDSNNSEKLIGYATNLSYQVQQGQKAIFTVDSPFPAEIAQSAAPSMVRGSITLYMPKGTSPESVGLVPYRTTAQGHNNAAATRYLHVRLYDRQTGTRVVSLDFCKIGAYSVTIQARQIVRVDMQFEGILCTT